MTELIVQLSSLLQDCPLKALLLTGARVALLKGVFVSEVLSVSSLFLWLLVPLFVAIEASGALNVIGVKGRDEVGVGAAKIDLSFLLLQFKRGNVKLTLLLLRLQILLGILLAQLALRKLQEPFLQLSNIEGVILLNLLLLHLNLTLGLYSIVPHIQALLQEIDIQKVFFLQIV